MVLPLIDTANTGIVTVALALMKSSLWFVQE
jgi:hypothetical protein